jgi:hypothetical protein
MVHFAKTLPIPVFIFATGPHRHDVVEFGCQAQPVVLLALSTQRLEAEVIASDLLQPRACDADGLRDWPRLYGVEHL